MKYKTMVIDCAPKAKKIAAAVEKTANECAQNGWELVNFSITNSSKAVLVFRLTENLPENELPGKETLPEETAEAAGEEE